MVVEQRVAQPGADVGGRAATSGAGFAQQAAWPMRTPADERIGAKVFEFSPGSVCGVVDTYLRRPRSSRAVVAGLGGGSAARSGACRALRITRADLGRMAAEAPTALHILQVGPGLLAAERERVRGTC